LSLLRLYPPAPNTRHKSLSVVFENRTACLTLSTGKALQVRGRYREPSGGFHQSSAWSPPVQLGAGHSQDRVVQGGARHGARWARLCVLCSGSGADHFNAVGRCKFCLGWLGNGTYPGPAAILYMSYRQTIKTYPSNGGAYTASYAPLGRNASLLAAASLMVNYILNVAVGISARIGALTSSLPALQPWTLTLCLVMLGLIALVNLRGTAEAGSWCPEQS
jgi:hypothetical protein